MRPRIAVFAFARPAAGCFASDVDRRSTDVPRAPPDAELPAAEAAESEVDIASLFVAHAPFLLRVVERLTGAGPHVEDLVQEVFIVAHRRRRELRDVPALRGWLYRVASRQAQQHRRAWWRRLRLAGAFARDPSRLGGSSLAEAALAPADHAPFEVVARRQQGLLIRACALELPFLQREVFVLVDLEGLDAKTVAGLLDMPEGTVASRLFAARRLFRDRWLATSPQETR
jgi:RNA polymerase sigma-70 factor (ECF subfamily)